MTTEYSPSKDLEVLHVEVEGFPRVFNLGFLGNVIVPSVEARSTEISLLKTDGGTEVALTMLLGAGDESVGTFTSLNSERARALARALLTAAEKLDAGDFS